MPIYPPGQREVSRIRKMRIRERKRLFVSLSLTSMVDMFVILVVFLLQHYSATGEIITLQKDIKLPQAQLTKELKPAHVVSLSPNQLKLDGKDVYRTGELSSMGWNVAKLEGMLKEQLAKDMASGKFQEPGKPVNKELARITLEVDKTVPTKIVKKVIFTCNESGYPEINFAVMAHEKPVGQVNN